MRDRERYCFSYYFRLWSSAFSISSIFNLGNDGLCSKWTKSWRITKCLKILSPNLYNRSSIFWTVSRLDTVYSNLGIKGKVNWVKRVWEVSNKWNSEINWAFITCWNVLFTHDTVVVLNKFSLNSLKKLTRPAFLVSCS